MRFMPLFLLLLGAALLSACSAPAPTPVLEDATATVQASSPVAVASLTPATPSPAPEATLPPSATSSVIIPSATPEAVCAQSVEASFMALWEASGGTASGCPTEAAYALSGGAERFQHGLMLWMPGPNGQPGTVYVLYDSGEWELYPDTWAEGQMDRAGLTPPEGLVEPQRGFGKVWREQLGGPDATLGWATEFERPVSMTVQPFTETGRMIAFDGKIYYLPHQRPWSSN